MNTRTVRYFQIDNPSFHKNLKEKLMNQPRTVRTLITRMFPCRLPVLLLAIAALGSVFARSAQATTTVDQGFMLFNTVPISQVELTTIPTFDELGTHA